MVRSQEPTDTIVKCCISVGCSFISCLYCKGKDTHIFLKVLKFKVKMATGQSGEVTGETFHDVEVKSNDAIQGKLALQLHISQPGIHPLPDGVITAITIMNDVDSVIKFKKGDRMFESLNNCRC